MTYGVWVVYWLSYARYGLSFESLSSSLHLWSSNFLFHSTCNLILQGEALFQTHENLEHLAMMERVLGPLPQHMLKRVGYVILCEVSIVRLIMHIMTE